ncbi:MAG: site-specific integrase [Planctomycetaceae bacterium]|nr:site-specific integrase [Planctomycetaceae bacterium]
MKRLFAAVHARKYRRENKADEHALIYRLLVGTGLRSTELGIATPSQFDFDKCRFRVKAESTKNRREDILPIRSDLCQQLNEWVDKFEIQPNERIFKYSVTSIYRSFKLDCRAAGIELKSPDGRSVDVHALRRTFGTMLARAGLPLTTTQRLMRHSTPELTAKLYIDVEPVDIQQAIDKLPGF